MRSSVSCNISNMRRSVSSPDETLRRELKIQRTVETLSGVFLTNFEVFHLPPLVAPATQARKHPFLLALRRWDVPIVIRFYQTLHFEKFQSIVNHWWKFYSDQTRIKSLLKRLKNIGIASEKLYRNALKAAFELCFKRYKQIVSIQSDAVSPSLMLLVPS